MPWRTESVMDQRVEFVMRAKAGEETIAELCRKYGISRPTGYLWLDRYQAEGSVKGLAERSRRPRQSPKETDEKVAAAGPSVEIQYFHFADQIPSTFFEGPYCFGLATPFEYAYRNCKNNTSHVIATRGGHGGPPRQVTVSLRERL